MKNFVSLPPWCPVVPKRPNDLKFIILTHRQPQLENPAQGSQEQTGKFAQLGRI